MTEPDTETTADEAPHTTAGTSATPEAALTQVSFFDKAKYADQRQKGGRWAPAFPETNTDKQEAYFLRMLKRDEELNLG